MLPAIRAMVSTSANFPEASKAARTSAANADADEATIRERALGEPNVERHLEGREPKKVIVVPGRLVNIVV